MTVHVALDQQPQMAPPSLPSPGTPPSSPGRFLVLLWEYRRALLLGAGIGLLLGVIIALLKPVTYTSSATLIFPAAPTSRLSALTGGSQADLPSLPLLEGDLMVPQPGSSSSTATVILQSNHVREKILQDLHLSQAWKTGTSRATRAYFDKHLLCNTGKNGEMIVGFQDTDPKRAYLIAQSLMDELDTAVKSLGLDSAQHNLDFLHSEGKKAYGKLLQAQNHLQVYQRQNHLIDATGQVKSLTEQYAQVQQNLATARIETQSARQQQSALTLKMKKLVSASTDPSPTSPSSMSSPLGTLYQHLKELEFDLAVLRGRFTDDYPDVRVKAQQVAVVRQQLSREMARQFALIDSTSSPALLDVAIRVVVAQAKSDGYAKLLTQLQQQMDRLPKQLGIHARLTAQLEAATAVYKLYSEEIEKARIIAESRGPVFTVVDPVALPEDADPSGRLMIVALMLLLGIGVALLFPYARWRAE